MNKEKVVKKLNSLIQLDIDAVEAYHQALKNIDDAEIHTKIKSFQQDHERHINELSKIVKDCGENPPKRTKDFKGFLIQGFTAIRSMTGLKGALKAMQTNENLTNKTYKEALEEDSFPEDIRATIQKNYDDEKRHLEYINVALKNLD